MVLFLASEVMFFGGLFGAYYALRSSTPIWPPDGVDLDTALATIATAILVISSFTFQGGVRAAEHGRVGRVRSWTLATIALGIIFLAIQAWDWAHLDFSVSSHAYGTMFFAMTGFHGLHVVGGLVLMILVVGRLAPGGDRDADVTGQHAVAYYWHFVDVVWVALFATLFVLR